MTDKLKSLTVFLEDNIREDDYGAVIDAIKLFPGVIDVKKELKTAEDSWAYQKAKYDLYQKIMAIFGD